VGDAPDGRLSFLIGGVQKGGTTALFDYLKGHPGLSLAPEKEVHFFDDEAGVDWSRPDYAAYHARFDPDRPGLRGEATPIYIYWPRSIERIAAYNPAIRLIFLFRDPVERAWSHWRMERSRGVEPMSFADSIRDGRVRVDDPTAPGFHRVHSYVERGFYGAQLKRVFRYFPREQVFLGGARQLRDDPALFLRNVCEFLGVPAFAEVEPIESHVGVDPEQFGGLDVSDRRFLTALFEEDQALYRQLGGPEL
jgi:hypothetical protein